MPVRALTLATLLIALTAIPTPAPAQEGAGAAPSTPPEVAAVVGGVATTDSLDVVAIGRNARGAYEDAWTQRQVGEHAQAVETAERALSSIDRALATDLHSARRRDLEELRSKIAGVRDAAQHNLEEVAAQRKRGDDGSADPRVLNAPALEEIRPQMNAHVYHYIEVFSGVGRSTFERWLKRSGRYMKLFRDVLSREGLPPDLVHLVFVESGFNVHARSVSAAVGPWQFLRSTGRLFGLTVNQWVDERRDPEKSTVAAARYLKHLYGVFGDWPLALASYNAGEGTVLRAIKRQGTTNYWDLKLPRQTEEYVPQFMAALAITRDPEKYGFSGVDLDDPMDFDEVALKGSVDLRAVARLAECSYDELRVLNPAVRGHAAPSKDGVTMLRVPDGKSEVIFAKLERGEKLPTADLTVKHHVRRGETLQGIARQYHIDATRLARSNGIGRQRPLRRGMVLTIRSPRSPVERAVLEPDDPRGSTAYVPERKIGLPARLDGESDAEGRLTVTVRRGETLQGIADRHGVAVADIKRWNRLQSSHVRRGTRLKIRTGEAAAYDPKVAAADSARVAAFSPPSPRRRSFGSYVIKRTVVVQAGETLGVIASRNGTTVTKIKRANGLGSSRIRAGQRLRIPA